MLLIVGALVVVGAVIGGFLMEGGHLLVLSQPAEFVIIGGAALGSVIIATPLGILKELMSQCLSLFTAPKGKAQYAELLSMLYQLFRLSQQGGIMALESHVEAPTTSAVFSKFPRFLAHHGALDFLSDSLKVMIVGGISPHDLDNLMEMDLEVRHHHATRPASALGKVGDSLPGLGIVAAVLGVVNTMGAIDGPPAEIGHKVGAALVGTFLGILLCYGFVNPLAARLEQYIADEGNYELSIRAGLVALYKGLPPVIAIEFARRVLPEDVRPSFEETEALCRAPKPEAVGGMTSDSNVIIIKKKKGNHAGSHGGAWKVAFADFMTAMMAFFLVMWLVGQSKATKAAVAGYFRDPGAFASTGGGDGILDGGKGTAPELSNSPAGSSADRESLERSVGHIRERLDSVPELKTLRSQIEYTITDEGLRIDLIETANSSFFDSGSAGLRPETGRILAIIARELGTLNNSIILEGHTDSRQYASPNGYTNWELSADRANAARRTMQREGLKKTQVLAVRGHADRDLRIAADPFDPRNRRVSVMVKSLTK